MRKVYLAASYLRRKDIAEHGNGTKRKPWKMTVGSSAVEGLDFNRTFCQAALLNAGVDIEEG